MTGIDERVDRAPFGVIVTETDGMVTAINETAAELLSLDDARASDISAVFPHSVDRRVPVAFDGSGAVEAQQFEEYYPELDRWLSVRLRPTSDDVTIYLQDVSDRKAAERTTTELEAELERMVVTERLVSEVLSELVDASSREEIAETICERLGSTDIYEFAWVGEREVGNDAVVVRASAGARNRLLEPVKESVESSTTSPEERAIEHGELQVVQPLADDPAVPDSVRQAAFAGGIQSMLAIPLTYGSNVYGVVAVYASGEDAFTPRERETFRTVGDIAGFAVNAARHRTLLLSDSVVEVTFRFPAGSGPLVGVSSALDATLSLDGTVPHQDGGLLCYIAVEGGDPEEAVTALDERAASHATRLLSRDGTAGMVEVEIGVDTPLGGLLSNGATATDAEFDDGTGRVVCEFAPEEDIRRIADAVDREFDGSVVAKRTRERDVTTPTELREELRDKLTERQETALRTAFLSNYFESPRGSTAEEVAEALDITGPTLLYHLRAGQRKLLETFFNTDPQRRQDGRE